MEKLNISVTEEIRKRLEVKRKKGALDSIPEEMRYILNVYLAKK